MAIPNQYMVISSLASGEWTPEMAGRVDLPAFYAAAQEMTNWYPIPTGGARTRGGLVFAAATKYTNTTLAWDFEFNNEQAYVIEAGDQYFRFYTEQARIEGNAFTITDVTNNAGAIVVTAAGHGRSNGDYVAVRGVLGVPNSIGDFVAANITANTLELTGAVFGGAYTSGGTLRSIYEIASPYAAADLPSVRYTQSADTMFLFHKDYATQKLTRTSADIFTLSTAEFTNGPYIPDNFLEVTGNVSAATITPSAATGNNVVLAAGPLLTVSSVVNTNNDVVVTFTGAHGLLDDQYVRIINTEYTVAWGTFQATVVNSTAIILQGVEPLPTRTITGCADNGSGLIRVTSAAHAWLTGQIITIAGVVGTTEANGDWTITKITDDTFDLQSSTFSNAYVSGGTAVQDNASGTARPCIWWPEPDQANRLVKMKTGSSWGEVRIIGTSASGTAATVNVISTLTDTTAKSVWALGAWGGEPGFPRAGVFYEDRLVPGGTLGQPQTIWGSRSGDYFDFDDSQTDDDYSYNYNLLTKKANVISWMSADDVLLVGTSGQEFKVAGGNDSGITPTSIFARPQSRHGSANVDAVQTSSGVLFVQKSAKKVRSMSYNLDKDRYTSPDVTLLSNKMVENNAVSMAYQAEPHELVWCVTADGHMPSLTILSDQNVVAWADHTTSGSFKSVTSIPYNGADQVWCVVQRTKNNSTVQYMEYLDSGIAVDSAVQTTFNSAITTVTSGLSHLEGRTVKVLGDGATYPDQVVTNGALPDVLDPSATSIVVGLEIPTPTIELFLPHKEFADGSTLGRPLKVTQVDLRVYSARGLSVNGQINPMRSTADDTDEAPPVETTDVPFSPDIGWNVPVKVTQHVPYPAHVLAISQYVQVGD